eukprot:gb/GECG01016123.1/.p1 GENE.gb/GECG01016123.1/~~gb/GECG01016123.1/.p1  ORF type:complete len:163 (+),score=28.64 gb/GECG01016123.1/:1-489(+)
MADDSHRTPTRHRQQEGSRGSNSQQNHRVHSAATTRNEYAASSRQGTGEMEETNVEPRQSRRCRHGEDAEGCSDQRSDEGSGAAASASTSEDQLPSGKDPCSVEDEDESGTQTLEPGHGGAGATVGGRNTNEVFGETNLAVYMAVLMLLFVLQQIMTPECTC